MAVCESANRLHSNQPLRYAIHHDAYPIGMVAPRAHQIGRIKSAASPSTVKEIQKILRSISLDCKSFPPRMTLASGLRENFGFASRHGISWENQPLRLSSSITLWISSLASVRFFMMSCTSMTGLPGQRWLWQ